MTEMKKPIERKILNGKITLDVEGDKRHFEGKDGKVVNFVSKEEIVIKVPFGKAKLTPIDLQGIFNLQEDEEFMSEFNNRLNIQRTQLKAIMGGA